MPEKPKDEKMLNMKILRKIPIRDILIQKTLIKLIFFLILLN